MLEEIFGVPTHPLLVHLVVVLLPVASLCGALVALVPALRRRYDLVVAGLAVVTAGGAVPLAMATGEELYDRRRENIGPGAGAEPSLIEQHKDVAETLWPWPLTLAVGTLLLLTAYRTWPRLRRVAGAGGRYRLPLGLLGSAVTLVGAVGTVVMTIKVGHAGSEAAWYDR